MRKSILKIIFVGVLFTCSAASVFAVQFTVRLAAAAGSDKVVSGRLLIFMRTDDGKPSNGFGTDFRDPGAVWVSGTEIRNLESGKTITVNSDTTPFPSGFSSAPAGTYQIFAVLDRDHSYTYNGSGAGDITSKVTTLAMPATAAEIVLTQTVPVRKIEVPANAKLIEYESPMLSAFWGRPVKMQASVVLPPSYETSNAKYPTVYTITGYGGTHLSALRGAPAMAAEMKAGKWPEMIYVNLESQFSLGHHVWADSVNNGPWGTALEKEFIPYVEKQFRMDAKPSGRFLTGHSSGGWATLWAMITHPDFFGGTWSTSPDPVDFRNFTGPDIYTGSSAFVDASGKEINLVRDGGKELMSLKQYAQQEMVQGYYGGQFGAFNAVFSPKGPDGQPMQLFDPATGRIDPVVAKAWDKYDISLVLKRNWKTLGPKLKGKINIIIGSADSFHLDESVRLLDAELKKLGSDARIEYLEGRTHFDLYKDGLQPKIAWEMYKIARPNAK